MRGNGLRSQVIDIALDTVVDHLNEHHPKSEDVRRVEAQRDTQKTKARRARRARDEWQRKCETATENAQMWMDEAIAQRERANLAEQERENWRITAINRTTPAVTREQVEDLIGYQAISDAVCDLFAVEAEQAVGTAETKVDNE